MDTGVFLFLRYGELFMFSIIIKASDHINRVLEKAAVSLFAIITVLTFLGIISRYAFGSPIIWLYETTLVLFSWTTFIGISIAFKKKEHIHLDFVFQKVSEKTGRIFRAIITAGTIVFFTIVLVDSIEIISETFGQKYNTINLSTGWFYIPLFLCSFTSIIHLASQLIEYLRKEK